MKNSLCASLEHPAVPLVDYLARVTPSLLRKFVLPVLLLCGAALSHAQVLPNFLNDSPGTIKQATGSNYIWAPGALPFQYYNGTSVQRNLALTWATNADGAASSCNSSIATLGTNGSVTPGTTITTPQIPEGAAIKQRNGAIVTYWFAPSYGPGGTGNGGVTLTNTQLQFKYYKSTDGGVTWGSALYATVNFSDQPDFASGMGTFRFVRDIIEESDGTLYAPIYGSFVGQNNRVIIIKSTDGGANWTMISTVAYSTTRTYAEPTLVRCKNDSWLCVMRVSLSSGANDVMRYRRSINQGTTWDADSATADPLPGITTQWGVDPELNLLPNGVLALSYGPANANASASRDLHIAYASDGNGTSWSDTTVFVGTLWSPGNTITSTSYESSGYTAIPSVSAHRFLHLSDTGASWSYNSTVPSPNPFTVRGRFVDVVITGTTNRIDLKTKFAQSLISVTTDLNLVDSANPETRPPAAFDGSTEYAAGAFKAATTGTYTIDLQSTHTLNKIGVCLKYHIAESATVAISPDGSTWTTEKTYTSQVHDAIDYFSFTPMAARYVRVSITGGTSPISLNEIEIYETADTFENNAVGIAGNPHGVIPPGYVENGTSSTQYGFAVRDASTSAGGYQSDRCLQMWDGSSTWRAGIKKSVTGSTSKTFSFMVKPLSYATTGGGIEFAILSGTANVYELVVEPDGSIKYFDGTNWDALTGTGSPAGAGTVALNTWTQISVSATISGSATVSVNGVTKGSAAKIGTPTTMDGFAFGSGGTTPSGDNALFDDVFMN